MAEIELKNVEEAKEKLAELEGVNKPTEEETKAAELELKEAVDLFNATRYDIGTPEEFEKVSGFILNFLENFVYWTKNGWMGVIKLHEEVSETRHTYTSGAFSVGYQALEFLVFALSNPGGTGLQSARDLESIAEEYGMVIEIAGKQLEGARANLKDIQWLQDKWTAMLQGFYLEKEDGVEVPEDTNDEQLPEDELDSGEGKTA